MRQARPRGINDRTRSPPKVTGKGAWNGRADRHQVEEHASTLFVPSCGRPVATFSLLNGIARPVRASRWNTAVLVTPRGPQRNSPSCKSEPLVRSAPEAVGICLFLCRPDQLFPTAGDRTGIADLT